jgi:hypothetical protein
MPLLTLKRGESPFGMFRSLKIEIDVQKVILLKYTEEKTIDLPVGTHTLIAKMSWTKSMPLSITLAENEHKFVNIECLPLLGAAIRSYIPPFVIFTLKEVPKQQ